MVLITVRRHDGSLLKERRLRKPIEDLCRKALEHKEITAWITANDYLALNCIDCLKKYGIAVPGDISIIGFDDCFEATNYNLTTCNFDTYTLLHSMYDYLSTYQQSSYLPKQTALDTCEGYIVERKTVETVVSSEWKI
jgi:DNA-binding LacI/PurR family transcriptional regulator